jgi:signal transduction histidine kinase
MEQAETILDQAIDTTRSLTVDLSPPVLKGEGLAQAFEWLAVQMEKTYGLTVNIETESSILIPSEDLRVLLFQLVRELLFNVVKHANVEQADLNMLMNNGEVRIIVTDKGEGFDPDTLDQRREDPAGGGFGLFSVRERLILFGGHLEVDSAPGRGTRMTLTAPIGDPNR